MKKAKKILALVLVIILAMSLFASCGKKDDSGTKDPGTTDPGTKDPGTTDDNSVINIATSQDSGTLYPFAVSGGFVTLMYAFYEPLFDITTDGEIVWMLATSMERISDIQYTIKLREGVTFSNGNPLTAEDVLFSMNVCKEDPRFYLNVKAIDFEKTSVTDEYTLDVWYTHYDASQEASFTQLHILDEESYDQVALSTNPIGTGPYVVQKYVVNSHVTCEAREDYWGGTPAIKTLNFKVINEDAQIVNALEVGDIDIASTLPVTDAEYVESLGYQIDIAYGGYNYVAMFSMAPGSPLESKEARWAISHAIDRESMAQILFDGMSTVTDFPASHHVTDYEERFANMHETYSVGYDLDRAKELAEQSGLIGKTVRIITNGSSPFNTISEMLQSTLLEIGVDATIVSYDQATYFNTLMDESNFEIAIFYPSCPSMLAADCLANYVDFVPLGWTGADRDAYGAISKQAMSTYDPTERGDILYEALEMFVEIDPWFGICEVVMPRAQAANVEGVEYYLAGNMHFGDLSFK